MIRHISRAEAKALVIAQIGEENLEKFPDWLAVTNRLWALEHAGVPICIWGMAPVTMLSTRAYIWAHVLVEGHGLVIARASRIAVAEMLQTHPSLFGYCQVGAEKSMRWMKWLGASFSAPVAGIGVPFEIGGR